MITVYEQVREKPYPFEVTARFARLGPFRPERRPWWYIWHAYKFQSKRAPSYHLQHSKALNHLCELFSILNG